MHFTPFQVFVIDIEVKQIVCFIESMVFVTNLEV